MTITAKEQGRNSGKYYIYEDGRWVDQITANSEEEALICYKNWKSWREEKGY